MENVLRIVSDWRVDSQYQAERIVLVERKTKDGKTFGFSTHRQIEKAQGENWMNPTKPNLCFGDYFDHLGSTLNQAILDKFNERRFEFYQVRKDLWSIGEDGTLIQAVFG